MRVLHLEAVTITLQRTQVRIKGQTGRRPRATRQPNFARIWGPLSGAQSALIGSISGTVPQPQPLSNN
jgi:hypothetical protein